MTHRSSRSVRQACTAVLVAGLLVLGACGGSSVSAEKAVRANAGVTGEGSGIASTVTGPGAVGDGTGTPAGLTGAIPPGSGTVSTPGGTGGTSGGSTSGSTTAGATTGTAAPATGKGVRAGSCDGFRNTLGITDDTIVIGNVADVSGPVPGIFTSAQQATKAYAAYFNATSAICGRKLEVKSYDSQTNTSADAVATQKTCDETFAAVGSMGAFDSGGTAIAKKCNLPEMHAIISNDARVSCATCFAASAPSNGLFPSAIPDYFTRTSKAATQKAAMVYVNAAASVGAAKAQVNAEQRRGWKFAFTGSFDIAEFNYGPLVQRMKSAGVRLVQMYGSSDMAVRMAKAMQAANFKPEIFLLPATQYDKIYAGGGSPVEGSVVSIDFAPLEEAGSNPELALYTRWLQQVAPGAEATYFGLYAWSAARLFSERATALGGKLTRASLVQEFKKVRGWTSNGLHAPQAVGSKGGSGCVRFIQLKSGTWSPYGPTRYTCNGLVSSR